MSVVLALLIGYFLGSIPSAYLTGRLVKGFDIRQVGTRNMGAMNIFYQVGFIYGLMVLLADVGKGAAALAIARWLDVPEGVVFLTGLFAVIGHSFPLWLKFRGGKGGATLIGVFVFLMPWGLPIGLSIFGLLMLLTRFPTLSYSIGLLCFPFIAWLIYHDGTLVAYSIGMLLVPALQYVPRVKEIYSKAGSWRRVLKRKNLKDRM